MADTFFWGNQWWKSSDKAAFTRWLQQHGTSYNQWARNHPALATKMFGGSSSGGTSAVDNLLAQANAMVDASLKASAAPINDERQRTAAQNAALMANTKDAYMALAGMLGSVGPQISGIYNAGASEDSAIGKGFSDAQAAIQKGEAGTVGDFLGKIGAPTEQISQALEKVGGPGAADVVYGLGSGLNAGALATAGSAFGAAGAMLPGEAAGIGQQNILKESSDAMQQDQSFIDKLNELYAGRSGMVSDALAKLQDNARADEAMRIQEAQLGNTLQNTAADNARADQQLKNQAAKDAAKAAATAKGNRAKAVKAREDAFAQAQQDIFKQAKGLLKPTTLDQQIAWVAQHPGKTLADAPKTSGPNYAAAKKALFNQYSYLLRYATRSGRAALKKRLNQLIDQALAAAGFTPPAAQQVSGGFELNPKAGAHPGERPG